MGTFAKIKSSLIEAGKRVLKFQEYGVKTANESAPFGDDSAPVSEMTAIVLNTSNISEPVIIGYINTNQLAAPGEKRLYSLDGSGNLSTYIWLKNDKTLELAGSAHTAVRFTPLNNAITTKDGLINTELGKIATAIGSLGGVYVPGNITTDLNPSNSPDVKIK